MTGSSVATVADLAELLDAEVVERPRGVAIPVGKVLVLDEPELAAGGSGVPRDAAVLLIGTPPGPLLTDQLPPMPLAAIVIRGELHPAIHDFALRSQAAVLRIDDGASWNDVLRRVKRLGPASAGRGAGGAGGSLDLFELADTAASIAGGPVTIEDPMHRILAYSADQSDTDPLRIQSLLHRRTPDSALSGIRTDGTLRKALSARRPLFIERIVDDARPRLVMPIRGDGDVLGLLWAVLPDGATPPVEQTTAAFARCADRVAAHLAQLDGALGRVRRIEVEHLARLLHSGDESAYHPDSRGLPDGVHWVLAVAFDLSPDQRTHARSRVIHLLDKARLTGDLRLVVGDLNDLLYVIVSGAGTDAAAVSGIVVRLGDIPGVAIGVSSPAAGAEELPQARQQAERALTVARHDSSGGRIAAFEDVWPTALLLRLAKSPLAAELTGGGPLRRLLALDESGAADYVATLREYLLAGADSREAAARLNVHVNTVRYRMGKLRDEVPLDLEDPLSRLVITLQLALLALQQRER